MVRAFMSQFLGWDPASLTPGTFISSNAQQMLQMQSMSYASSESIQRLANQFTTRLDELGPTGTRGISNLQFSDAARYMARMGALDGMGQNISDIDGRRTADQVAKLAPAMRVASRVFGETNGEGLVRILDQISGNQVGNMSEGELENQLRKFERLVNLAGFSAKALSDFVQRSVEEARRLGIDSGAAAQFAINTPAMATVATRLMREANGGSQFIGDRRITPEMFIEMQQTGFNAGANSTMMQNITGLIATVGVDKLRKLDDRPPALSSAYWTNRS